MQNKKFLSVGLSFLFLCSFSIFAQTPVYISPNNDGVQDELIVPLNISDKRYISEWSFVIENSNNEVVRTISNKYAKPSTATDVFQNLFSGKTFKEFWQNLKTTFAPKQGVQIPESVMWNGVLDSGEIAPDGEYKYYLVAKDDNYNEGKTSSFTVIVDNTHPVIDLVQPTEGAKIFGAGNKPSIAIKQEGSVEDKWVAQISSTQGQVVKSFEWKNAGPESITWDGRNDEGSPVTEGVYVYKITTTDRAGNTSEPAQINNIIYDAIPRSVNLIVKDSTFSPNSDNIKDYMTIEPSIPNVQGLVNWEIKVLQNDKELKNFAGKDKAPQNFPYDGKDTNGKVLADGDYQLSFKAFFNNGQEAFITRNFTVDNTAPRATIRAESNIFSPDGDGKMDTITISQSTSKEKQWKGEIINKNGKVIRSYDFGEMPPTSLNWDGMTNAGAFAGEDFYKYVISATDLAGNTGTTETAEFELNTGTTEVILAVQPNAFSPDGDKKQDTITFSPIIKSKSGIAQYKLTILDGTNSPVKVFEEKKSIPSSIAWNGIADNGTRCTDGTYTAKLETVSKNGSEAITLSQPFVIDTKVPTVEISSDYLTFSPNNDGKKDALAIKINTSEETLWTASIKDAKGTSVKDISWQGKAQDYTWDGNDESGNLVQDGDYSFTISSTDIAGNTGTATIKAIKVDNRSIKTYVTADYESFSPNGDNYKDLQKFSIMTSVTDGIDNWNFSILDTANAVVQQWSDKDSKDLPSVITWDGTNSSKALCEGKYKAKLYLEYTKGDVIDITVPEFICSTKAPQLVVKVAPQFFSPDNDGQDDDLFISLTGESLVAFKNWSFTIKDPNGRDFWTTSGKAAITERIIWDGRSNSGELVQSAMDYPYEFTVTDELGMTSQVKGLIPIDILVIRIGDVLKIQVPSIIFRGNAADFKNKSEANNGLEQSVIDNNIRVLKRIAQILNKFKDYTVSIEGHANAVSGTEDEIKILDDLSKQRADYVKSMLVKYGVTANRLSTIGVGGRQPIAPMGDTNNTWKNRRVEFILNK